MTEVTETATSAEVYARQRDDDWSTFVAGSGAPADHWEIWKDESFDWRPEISFFQPVGVDHPDLLEPIQPLLDVLEGMEEIDLPPLSFLHLRSLRIGFLRAEDIMWSQVESYYVNAAPRIHKVAPFSIHVGGISAHEDALYLGVDDGFALRELRRQVALGVPKIHTSMREQGVSWPDDDPFVPEIPFAYFTGRGDRRAVIEAVESYRDADLGTYEQTMYKLGRIGSDPQIHYPSLDVIAEIRLLGDDHRKGYHN